MLSEETYQRKRKRRWKEERKEKWRECNFHPLDAGL
jgi:hypothetical protein